MGMIKGHGEAGMFMQRWSLRVLIALLFTFLTSPPALSQAVRVLEGGGWVSSVAFSPDGRLLVSGSNDGTIRLWDVTAGKELRRLEGQGKAVFSVAFSPDGRLLASASEDPTIRLWDVDTGIELRRLKGHESVVVSVIFSPDGRFLASGSADLTVRLWDVSLGEELRRLEGHEKTVFSVVFSPDGHLLASGSLDNIIRLWNVAVEGESRRLEGHKDWASRSPFPLMAAFSPLGQWTRPSASGNFRPNRPDPAKSLRQRSETKNLIGVFQIQLG